MHLRLTNGTPLDPTSVVSREIFFRYRNFPRGLRVLPFIGDDGRQSWQSGAGPKAELVLTDDERETLERWARRPKRRRRWPCGVASCSSAPVVRPTARCRVVLGFQKRRWSKWRRRFITHRLEGLHDEPRPGVPRSITDDDVEALIVATLEQAPTDATHWSTRSMAKATGMSQSAVSRIWRAFGLKPHLRRLLQALC